MSKYIQRLCLHWSCISDICERLFLIGDINARTGILEDYVSCDYDIVNEEMLPLELCDIMNDVDELQAYGIPIHRCNEDKGRVNSHGYKLLDFCKNNNLHILNSRIGEDIGIGRVTCKGVSVVDYAIAGAVICQTVASFKVHEFEPLFLTFTHQFLYPFIQSPLL